jgi:hypothetical protein
MNDNDKINRLEVFLRTLQAEVQAVSSRLEDLKNQNAKTGESPFSPPQYFPSSSVKPVIAFGCSYSGLNITVKQGKCYFKGVSKSCAITNPITIAATSYGYYSLALDTGEFTWTVSTTDPGDGDDDTEIWRVFVATVAGGKITELLECQHGDIRSMGNA